MNANLKLKENENQVFELGLIDYQKARELQEDLVSKRQKSLEQDSFIVCEHPRVFTLGTQSLPEDFIKAKELSAKLNSEVSEVSRGGGLSIHEPGVLMIYPVISLKERKTGLRSFLLLLLEELSSFLESYFDKYPFSKYSLRFKVDKKKYAIWVGSSFTKDFKKVASVGFKVERGVTNHGLSLNLNNNLEVMSHFSPCQIPGGLYSSILNELIVLGLNKEEAAFLIKELSAKIAKKLTCI